MVQRYGWIIGLIACPLAAWAQTSNVQYATAQVISATPIVQQVQVPHTTQQCRQVMAGASTERSTIGTLVGGAVGGLLGSRFGKGSGNSAMTALGAIAGAVGGHYVAENGLDGYGEPAQQATTQCAPVTSDTVQDETTGYNVSYRYDGQTYTGVMRQRPGSTVRVAVTVALAPE
ncbi:MAG TPA: glycine zipper 2TM domain-containing protein [Nevskiaceae bacterium]|nr:glycine zipper 2TM domain-containing protein [Nevskiaceae bacterium]